MKKFLPLAIIILSFVSCDKLVSLLNLKHEVEVPATVSASDIQQILRAKDFDEDKLEAYLPVFVRQHTQQVTDFLNNPTEGAAANLQDVTNNVMDIISLLEGVKPDVDKDFKSKLEGYINALKGNNDKVKGKVKEILASQKAQEVEYPIDDTPVETPSYDSYLTITGDGVRLRYYPSLDAGIYTKLNRGARVQRTYDDTDEWYGILYNGQQLYVSKEFAY